MIAPAPGRPEVVRFAKGAQLDRLSRECSQVVHRKMTVRFETTEPSADEPPDDPQRMAPSGPRSGSRRAAMELPLVREAFEVFPDAMLLDVRSESTD